jgi:hypothetical protein
VSCICAAPLLHELASALVIQLSSSDAIYEGREVEDANWDSALGFAIHFRPNLKADDYAGGNEHPAQSDIIAKLSALELMRSNILEF